ncbi:MAG: hypothetical protein SGI88_17670 [Candidatus Hydrogenedentes bacterium]|nr:hypothetical protein [Candidatus Hydrogenedentota bacterium]
MNDSEHWIIAELVLRDEDTDDVGGNLLASDVQPGGRRTFRLSESEVAGVFGVGVEVSYTVNNFSQGMGTGLMEEFQIGEQYDIVVFEGDGNVPGLTLEKQ